MIPTELKTLNRWVGWKLEERDGKWTKPPYDAKLHSSYAKSTDPETWCDYATAKKAVDEERADGVGFVFDGGDYSGIDFDHCLDGGEIEPWAEKYVEQLDSYTEVSPSGKGLHIIIRGSLPEGLRNRKDQIEIYSRGRYFTMTGKHWTGTPETIESRQDELMKMHAEVFPAEMVEKPFAVKSTFNGADAELLEKARKAENGDKFISLYDRGDISAYAGDDSAGDQALVNMLVFWCGPNPDKIDRLFRGSALCREKWTDRQDYRDRTIAAALNSSKEYYTPSTNFSKPDAREPESPVQAARNGKPWDSTDIDNARRLTFYFGNRLRHCGGKFGRWYVWNGRQWVDDERGRVYRYAEKTADKILDEARIISDKGDDKMAKMLIGAWSRLKSRSRLENMVYLAQFRDDIPVLHTELDKDSMLLNCRNGTINLKTGELQKHNPADLITKIAPVGFDADAQCPLWLSFLDRVMAGNEILIGYLQRLFGYCLTGIVTERIFPIFYGPGANGKSVCCDTITGLMGDYAGMTAPDLFLMKGNNHPTELADLHGRRLMVGSEAEAGSKLRVQLIKRITGDKTLKARYMRQDFFEFEQTHKLILCTNNKPRIYEKASAIWDRVKLVPFSVTIPELERDKKLLVKLKKEWPGILNWIVAGCLAWQQGGLSEPDEVIEATGQYREDEDPLAEFFADCCVFGHGKTPVKEMREAYERWGESVGIKPVHLVGRSRFNEGLKDKDCDQRTVRLTGEPKPVRCWYGVMLRGENDVTDRPKADEKFTEKWGF